MKKAIISKSCKNVMQSGSNTGSWTLQLVSSFDDVKENKIGWAASLSNENQVVLSFATLEEAIAYAERENISYLVKKENTVNREKKSYIFHFTKDHNLYYY